MTDAFEDKHFGAATLEEIESMVSAVHVASNERDEIIRILDATHTVLKGHYELRTGGYHSEWFIAFPRIGNSTEHRKKIALMMVELLTSRSTIDVVLSGTGGSAFCGISVKDAIPEARFLSANIDSHNPMLSWLGNGKIAPGEKVLIVTDIVTTGSGVRDLIAVAKECQGDVVGVLAFACRYEGGVEEFARKLKDEDNLDPSTVHSLIDFQMERSLGDGCQLCKDNVPLVAGGHLTH